MLRDLLGWARGLWWWLTGLNVPMTSSTCEDVAAFADGELLPGAAEVFRGHLPSCARCQRELKDLLHLNALSEPLQDVRPVWCVNCGDDVRCSGCGTPVMRADLQERS